MSTPSQIECKKSRISGGAVCHVQKTSHKEIAYGEVIDFMTFHV